MFCQEVAGQGLAIFGKASGYMGSQYLFIYMEVSVVIELAAVFKPDDFRPRLARCDADENNLMSQNILVIKMRGFGYPGPLKKENICILGLFT